MSLKNMNIDVESHEHMFEQDYQQRDPLIESVKTEKNKLLDTKYSKTNLFYGGLLTVVGLPLLIGGLYGLSAATGIESINPMTLLYTGKNHVRNGGMGTTNTPKIYSPPPRTTTYVNYSTTPTYTYTPTLYTPNTGIVVTNDDSVSVVGGITTVFACLGLAFVLQYFVNQSSMVNLEIVSWDPDRWFWGSETVDYWRVNRNMRIDQLYEMLSNRFPRYHVSIEGFGRADRYWVQKEVNDDEHENTRVGEFTQSQGEVMFDRVKLFIIKEEKKGRTIDQVEHILIGYRNAMRAAAIRQPSVRQSTQRVEINVNNRAPATDFGNHGRVAPPI